MRPNCNRSPGAGVSIIVSRAMTSDARGRPRGDADGEPSDAALARLAADGDRDAAGALIDRHQAIVRHFLRRLTGCDATADDLAQETFIRMLRYAHRYDKQYAMRTWLLTIARRLYINHGRSARRTRATADWPRLASNEPQPLERLAEAEDTRRLRSLLDEGIQQLTSAQREALLLFHQQGLTIEDAAAVMELPPNTVKSHLHRGRAALREKLGHLAEKSP